MRNRLREFLIATSRQSRSEMRIIMKKIMIASDIHGSAYYCRQLLERYKEEKAERLILLGDI